MEIIKTIERMKDFREKHKGMKIGFVPTMGFLHEGHISLVKKARAECDLVVVSIYVNPTQFAPNEDLESYPRDFEKDSNLCEKKGVDVIFFPSDKEMYPNGLKTGVVVDENITNKLCGKTRPTHFAGVTTIVAKLFDIIKPDKAYFGQKDYQQTLVIKQMVKDSGLDVNIVVCPIVRESDGLAKSSRNKYLSSNEREEATVLFKSLERGKKMFSEKKGVEEIKQEIIKLISSKEHAKIDYVEILDAETLKSPIEGQNMVIALAVKFGRARLIDNAILG